MANYIREYGSDYQNNYKGNDVVVAEYEANIEHMKEV